LFKNGTLSKERNISLLSPARMIVGQARSPELSLLSQGVQSWIPLEREVVEFSPEIK
jgi:hypothetical protein